MASGFAGRPARAIRGRFTRARSALRYYLTTTDSDLGSRGAATTQNVPSHMTVEYGRTTSAQRAVSWVESKSSNPTTALPSQPSVHAVAATSRWTRAARPNDARPRATRNDTHHGRPNSRSSGRPMRIGRRVTVITRPRAAGANNVTASRRAPLRSRPGSSPNRCAATPAGCRGFRGESTPTWESRAGGCSSASSKAASRNGTSSATRVLVYERRRSISQPMRIAASPTATRTAIAKASSPVLLLSAMRYPSGRRRAKARKPAPTANAQ